MPILSLIKAGWAADMELVTDQGIMSLSCAGCGLLLQSLTLSGLSCIAGVDLPSCAIHVLCGAVEVPAIIGCLTMPFGV